MTGFTKDYRKSWGMVHSGRHVFPFDVTLDDIQIDDICHHLGNICRYNGAPDEFYSVAEHSKHIADALRRDGYSPLIQLQGLLHDGPEFITQDMTRPRKNALRDLFPEAAAFLQANEEEIGRLVALKFDLPWPYDPIVDEYDGRIINDEKAFIFGTGKPWSHGGLPLNVDIQCWEPAVARRQMKFTFYKLWRELGRETET